MSKSNITSGNRESDSEEKSDWKLKPFTQLIKAWTVVSADNPIEKAASIGHNLFWLLAALVFAITLSSATFMAGWGAPYVTPFMKLWTYSFKQFFIPVINYPVILVIFAGIILATGLIYLVCQTMAKRLSKEGGSFISWRYLLLDCSIVSAFICLLALVLVQALGWILALLNIHIFVVRWMATATFPIMIIITLWIVRVFNIDGIKRKKSIYAVAAVVASYVVLMSAAGGSLIEEYLANVMTENGGVVFRARNYPISGVVQMCETDQKNITCVITLWPQQWQGAELFGAWTLGSVNQDSSLVKKIKWSLAKSEDLAIPIVNVEEHKEISVEINVLKETVCSNLNALNESDIFFFVHGRMKGVQQLIGRELKIRIDNQQPHFPDLLRQACNQTNN